MANLVPTPLISLKVLESSVTTKQTLYNSLYSNINAVSYWDGVVSDRVVSLNVRCTQLKCNTVSARWKKPKLTSIGKKCFRKSISHSFVRRTFSTQNVSSLFKPLSSFAGL